MNKQVGAFRFQDASLALVFVEELVESGAKGDEGHGGRWARPLATPEEGRGPRHLE